MQLNSKAQKKWKTLVDKWQSSGLTQKEFCQLNDISLRAFQNNKTKLKKNSTGSSQNNSKTIASVKFLPVSVKDVTPMVSAFETPIKIQLNQYLISVCNGFNPNALKSLFQVINEL